MYSASPTLPPAAAPAPPAAPAPDPASRTEPAQRFAPAPANRPAQLPAPAQIAAAAPLSTDLRIAIASGIARARPLWEGQVRHDGPTRHAVRLLAQENYEAWVIGWPPGHHTTVHDHGGSAAVIVVVEGELVEVNSRRTGEQRRHLVEGDAVAMPGDAVHDVGNDTDRPATSVHVYSPPLAAMTFYDDNGVPDAVLELSDEVPLYEAHQFAAGLHPSRWSRG